MIAFLYIFLVLFLSGSPNHFSAYRTSPLYSSLFATSLFSLISENCDSKKKKLGLSRHGLILINIITCLFSRRHLLITNAYVPFSLSCKELYVFFSCFARTTFTGATAAGKRCARVNEIIVFQD